MKFWKSWLNVSRVLGKSLFKLVKYWGRFERSREHRQKLCTYVPTHIGERDKTRYTRKKAHSFLPPPSPPPPSPPLYWIIRRKRKVWDERQWRFVMDKKVIISLPHAPKTSHTEIGSALGNSSFLWSAVLTLKSRV